MPEPSLGGPIRRAAVVGATGCGKTVLARRLAAAIGAPHIELDALHWGPHWAPRPEEVFRALTEEATRGEAWVTDGNYSAVRDIVWARADTLVWLDYPWPLILRRLLERTVWRCLTGEALFSGNRETWRAAFLAGDNLFLYLARDYRRRRRLIPELLRRPAHAHLRVARLRSPEEAEGWGRTYRGEVGARDRW